jgi:hypothetical protein
MLGIVQVILSLFLLISLTKCYELGYTYKYGYETNVEMFTAKNRTKKSNVYLVQAEFELEQINNNLYKIKFLNIHEAEQLFDTKTKIKILEKPIRFEYENEIGKTDSFYFDEDGQTESKGSLLFKKSVVDLFNFYFKDHVQVKIFLLGFFSDLTKILFLTGEI